MNTPKKLAGAMLALTLSATAFSQDMLHTSDKHDIYGIVKRITPTQIKYVSVKSLHGEITTIPAKDVDYIIYENGDKEVIYNEDDKENAKESPEEKAYSMARKGKRDAKENYHQYGGATTGTVLTTVLTGDIFGLIPAIACSSTPPKEENLNYPSAKLMRNDDYNNAYKEQARKIKSHKVWGSYVLGAIINFAVFAALILLL